MTRRRDSEIRADLAVFFRWTDKPDPKWRYEGDAARRLANDVEPLLLEVERLSRREDGYRIEGHGLRSERDALLDRIQRVETLIANEPGDENEGRISKAMIQAALDGPA